MGERRFSSGPSELLETPFCKLGALEEIVDDEEEEEEEAKSRGAPPLCFLSSVASVSVSCDPLLLVLICLPQTPTLQPSSVRVGCHQSFPFEKAWKLTAMSPTGEEDARPPSAAFLPALDGALLLRVGAIDSASWTKKMGDETSMGEAWRRVRGES